MNNPSERVRAASRDSRATASPVPSCTVAIKAIPNAPRSEIVGWLGDALKVKLHAPPVEGRANEALCDFLAETLDLPRRAVTLLRGDTSRQKLVRIAGLTLAELQHRLGKQGIPAKCHLLNDTSYSALFVRNWEVSFNR